MRRKRRRRTNARQTNRNGDGDGKKGAEEEEDYKRDVDSPRSDDEIVDDLLCANAAERLHNIWGPSKRHVHQPSSAQPLDNHNTITGHAQTNKQYLDSDWATITMKSTKQAPSIPNIWQKKTLN